MRTSSFLKLLACSGVCLSACQCGPPEAALQVVINIDAVVPATCVEFEVASGATVLAVQKLPRPAGKDSFRVGVRKLALPEHLQLIARSYLSASGSGCAEPRAQTSVSSSVDAQFPKTNLAIYTLEIHPPGLELDADGDGHISIARGGDDCNDTDSAIHPGLQAACGSTLDNDCDGKIGCADTECVAAAICTTSPAALAFVTLAVPVNANVCSQALTVEMRDASMSPIAAAVDTLVGLAVNPSGGVIFYSDPACLTAVTQATLRTGQSRVSFHFKAAAASTFEVSALVLGLPPAAQTQTVTALAPTQLVFATSSQGILAGACSSGVTVQTRDGANSVAPVSAATSIALSTTGVAVTLFSDASCLTVISAPVPLAAGDSSIGFFFKGTVPGALSLTAASAGLASAIQPQTIGGGLPSRLGFSPAQALSAGQCSSPAYVETQDVNGSASNISGSALAVTLGGPAPSFAFFSDAACSTAVTGPLSIPVGGTRAPFHFKGTAAGPQTISATATALTAAMRTHTVSAAAPSVLVFTSAVQSQAAGTCSQFDLEARDAFGNPSAPGAVAAVALTSSVAATFSATAGCAAQVSSVGLTGTTVSFFARSSTLGPDSLTATAPFASASQTYTVTAAAQARLVFTVQPTSAASGSSIAPAVQVSVQDALGNPVVSTAMITLSLATNPGSGVLSGTLTAAAVAGAASFAGLSIDKAGSGYSLLATSTGLTSVTSGVFNITAGPATRLVILGTRLTLPALSCSALRSVELQDANGNPVLAAAATALNYTSAPGSAMTTFYSDPACAVPATAATRTIAAGTNQVGFYFLAQNAAPTLTLTASRGGLTSGTQTATIVPALPTQLVFTTPPATVEAGFCQALTLERQDSAARPTSPTFPTLVTRSSSPLSGIEFFSDPGCVTALAATFDILSGTPSTVVYVKGISGSLAGTIPGAQTYGLTASATGLSNGTLNVIVLPMVRRGGCTLLNGSNMVTCPVTPAIPGGVIARTFLVFAAAGTAASPGDANVVCRLNSGGGGGGVDVVCNRAGTIGAVSVVWQTVSHARSYAAGGITVQHSAAIFNAGNPSPFNVTIPSVDVTQSFLLFSTATVGTTNGANDFLTARLTNATTVTVAQSPVGGNFSSVGGYSLQVVSFANSAVLRSIETAAVGEASVAVTGLAPAVVNRTFSLMTSRTSTVADDAAICKRRLRGVVSSATGLAFTRGDGAVGSCVDSDIAELAWERIELPAVHGVQSVTVTHASNAATGSATLASQVDLTRSVVLMSGQGMGGQAGGESNYSASAVIGAVLGLPTFDAAGTTVTVTRAGPNFGTATFSPFVIQFAP